MTSTGSYLREHREHRGVSLEELAHATRIGRRFLEALERDDFAALPAGPFAKGFIRAYCQALHESPDQPLALYLKAVPSAVSRPDSVPPTPRENRSLAPVFISLALLVILGGALGALTAVLHAGREGGAPRGGPPVSDARAPRAADRPGPIAGGPRPNGPAPPAAAPSAPPALAPSPVAVDPSPLVSSPPERQGLSSAGTETPYRLVARASDPTWIRVRMQGGRTIEETIPAGEVREWVSNHPFELRIGNAGGVTLELNGQALPSLGARGDVITHLVLPAEPR